MSRVVVLVCMWCLIVCATALSQQGNEIVEAQTLGFENGELGELPQPWNVPTQGWRAELSEAHAAEGKVSLKLAPQDGQRSQVGNVMQMVEAAPYRGKHVRLSAKIRVEGQGASAMMWFRVDRPEQAVGFFDNMSNRPIPSGDWREAVIEGEVDADAEQLALGVLSNDCEAVYIDELKWQFSEGIPLQAASLPRRATEQGVQNLAAAARLLAYVRFFHPSDQAVAMEDWEGFSIALMEAAESAVSPEELANQMAKVLSPVAPDLSVWAGALEDASPIPPAPAEAKHLRYWEHIGAGRIAQKQSIYSSKLKQVGIPGKTAEVDIVGAIKELSFELMGPTPAAKVPDSPYLLKSLGGGVCCRLPVMVYVGASGSLPTPTMENPWKSREGRPRLSALNRSTRLAGVAVCWGVMQHFYPYFDVVDTDWDAALTEAIQQAAEDSTEIDYLHTLQELIAKLKDGHGFVHHPGVQPHKGLPVRLQWAGDEVVVVGRHESAPPQVVAGDSIVSIEGKSLQELTDKLSARISAATDGWRRTILCGLLRTDSATSNPCSVRLRKPDGMEYDITMSLISMRLPIESSLTRPANGSELAPGIVYFDLNGEPTEKLNEIMDQLKAAKGIVFDLRGYPGSAAIDLLRHLRKEKTASASWNIPLVSLPDRNGWVWNQSAWDLEPNRLQLTAKTVFLTDGQAISYAESIMGIVEHYKLGDIVGGATAGTNGNVNPFELPGGFHVSWTGMKVLKHDGSQHHGVGIIPTVQIEPSAAGIAAGRDEVLERGVEVLIASL